MNTIFGKLAPKYDLFNRLASFCLDEHWRNCLACHVHRGVGVDVLDVCTGTGELAIKLAMRTNGRVLGVDLCREMLKIAQRKATACGRKVNFVLGKAESLSFREDNFDIVVSGFAMRNVTPRLELVLEEMWRVLKPNGTLMVLEIGVPESSFLRKIYFLYLQRAMPLLGSVMFRERAPFLYLKSSIMNSIGPDQMREMMTKAGFRDALYLPINRGITGIYKARK